MDTHLDTHTAAICDARGRPLAQLQVPATGGGYAQLLAVGRRRGRGRPVAWAIEGTRHYGLGLARYLASQGQQVAEIDATRHVGRRRAGKSDPIDAVRAARELLARPHPAQMRADGDREALRLLMIDRDNAVAVRQDRPHRAGLGPGHRPGAAARPAPPHPRRAPRPGLRAAGLPAPAPTG